MDSESRRPLPIVAYGSLITALDHFNEAGGAPSELHTSVFPKKSFSGSTISRLLQTLRALGASDDAGKVIVDRLQPLIEPKTRKSAFENVLRELYGSLIDLPLSTASPNMFNRWFDEFKMSADDTRKSKTFFLHAAKANGITVSNFILNAYKTRSRGATRKRSPKPPPTPRNNVSEKGPDESPQTNMLNVLLAKFPEFNPEWSAEVQQAWFEGFAKLQDRFKP